MSDPSDHEARALVLLRQAMARVEAGESVDVAALCRDEPELAATVAEALSRHAELAQLLRTARHADPLAGSLLNGRYRLHERLGQGAMGVVYRADDEQLRRQVAVKLFSPLLAGDPTAEQRFLREAELLARLRHQHVVTVFDRGRSEQGMLFLVTELLVGTPLATLAEHGVGADPARDAWPEILRRRPPPEANPLRLAAKWTADLAAGLGAAHAAGVFHRDVKPSNVFVCEDHRAVLLDFGIAKSEGDATFTATATTLGTPYYMAPEQAAGSVRSAAAVDVYGLCATLYHLLAGQPPYLGDARAVLTQIARQDPEPLRRLRPDLPRDLRAIVERGMERDPKRRYRDMAALERDLRAFLEYRPVRARPIGALGRLFRKLRRAPAASAAAALGVLALLLLAVAIPLYREGRAHTAAARLGELDMRLPPLLAFEGTKEQRARIPAAEQAGHLELLSSMLALDAAQVLPRLLRASVHEDIGDLRAAAADLEFLGHGHAEPFLRELAARTLQAAPASVASAGAAGSLPEPSTLAGRCAAATRLLRQRDEAFGQKALAVLAPVRAEPSARELRVVALLAYGERGGGTAAYLEVLQELAALRSQSRHDSARWLAAEGTALLVLRRHEEALATLLEADRLAPERHGTLLNLGIAYRRMTRLAEAHAALEKAQRIRPWHTNTKVTLAQVLKDEGRLDEALAVAAEIPETGDDAWRRHDVLGGVHLRRAFQEDDKGNVVARGAAATRAHDELTQALTAATGQPAAQKARLKVLLEMASMVRAGDKGRTKASLFEMLAIDPANPYEIDTVATWLAEGELSAEAVVALRRYLRSLAEALAPGDVAFRDRQARRRKEEQPKGR